MSDGPVERENLTAALVRDLDDEALVEWIHALQDREEELEARVADLQEERAGLFYTVKRLIAANRQMAARAALAAEGKP